MTWNEEGQEAQSDIGGRKGTHVFVDSYSLLGGLVDLNIMRKDSTKVLHPTVINTRS